MLGFQLRNKIPDECFIGEGSYDVRRTCLSGAMRTRWNDASCNMACTVKQHFCWRNILKSKVHSSLIRNWIRKFIIRVCLDQPELNYDQITPNQPWGTFVNKSHETTRSMIKPKNKDVQQNRMHILWGIYNQWVNTSRPHIHVSTRQSSNDSDNVFLLIRPLKTNFSEILIETESIPSDETHLKISPAKWRLFFCSTTMS